MNNELISDIYKSKDSCSFKNHLESKKVQEAYRRKFIKEFEILIERKNKEHEKERKNFSEVKKIIETEIFQYILDNNKYCEKAINILTKEKMVVGESDIKLRNIYNDLSKLCDNYKKEYEAFVADSEKRMEADLRNFDKESKLIFETIFNSNVCKQSFYNILCNYKMI